MTPEEYRSLESRYIRKTISRTDFYRKLLSSGLPENEALKCINYVDGYYDDDVVITLTTSSGDFRGLLLRVPRPGMPKTFEP
jgi:hypothetical protein